MALGVVVARFGLFLSLLAGSSVAGDGSHHSHWASSVLGIALVALGAATILAALHNHQVYVRSLPPEDLPKLPIPSLTSLLALSVAIVGLLLAVYLAAA
jgi:putative membrane protein